MPKAPAIWAVSYIEPELWALHLPGLTQTDRLFTSKHAAIAEAHALARRHRMDQLVIEDRQGSIEHVTTRYDRDDRLGDVAV